MTEISLGGVAATSELVIVSDRELNDSQDSWKCFHAITGEELWVHRYPTKGTLDFGNSPRATPVIRDGKAFLFGAHGHLSAIDLKTGLPDWQINLRDDFQIKAKMLWGLCATPLYVDGKLILSPGAEDASIIAVDAKTGKLLWKTPGEPASYGSFIVATFGGKKQIIGYTATLLQGWEMETGKKLWSMKPPKDGDYNVPTPLVYKDTLIVSTENNFTRRFRFDAEGKLDPKPIASHPELGHETQCPVIIGDRLFGIGKKLYAVDLKNGMKTLWSKEDFAFEDHVSMIASPTRLLISTMDGELLLLDAEADQYKELGRVRILENEKGLYCHPALVGTRLYMRGSRKVICVELK